MRVQFLHPNLHRVPIRGIGSAVSSENHVRLDLGLVQWLMFVSPGSVLKAEMMWSTCSMCIRHFKGLWQYI